MIVNYKLALIVVFHGLMASPIFANEALVTDGELQNLGFLTSPSLGASSTAHGVSGNGSVVIGTSTNATGFAAFRWTADGSMSELGHILGNNSATSDSEALGISANGLVIVGYEAQSALPFVVEAFRWTASEGMQGLGFLPGAAPVISWANAANADGSVIVGASNNVLNDTEAFRWTSAGMVGLGYLGTNLGYSEAKGVSADASIVVGMSENTAGGFEAFRWSSGSMLGLGHLTNVPTHTSQANAISADGAVIVGKSNSTGGEQEAFRWTSSAGMVGLGLLPGKVSSFAQAVNADGSVVVGHSSLAGDTNAQAFRWTSSDGMKSVKGWLTDNGVAVASTVSLKKANGVSDDGSVVVGSGDFGRGDEAFIARISGVISQRDAYDSIGANAIGGNILFRTVNTLVNGAHSRPLSRRVKTGQNTLWLAGDWAHDDIDNHDGSMGLAEVGVGHNFGLAQINLSLGKTWTDQSIQFSQVNSDIDSSGTYIMLESIFSLSEDLGFYATLGGYSHWSDADIRRGYLNAGLSDHSSANPDRYTWGLRARVDWENALTLAEIKLSPYVDLSYNNIKMESYTETGGGFPAHFNSRQDSITEVHFGLNGLLPINSLEINLLANFEATHRFNARSSSTSGQYLGLFSFDIDERKYNSTWIKGGLGAEIELGNGRADLMLNATTEGEMPSAWLAFSYQYAF